MKAWEKKQNFERLVMRNAEIRKQISDDALKNLFDLSPYFRHIDTIFSRVFAEEKN